ELRALREKIDSESIRNVLDFALLSAKRHGEILNLTWSDVDFEAKRVRIHSSEHYRVKFGKEQNLPLSEPMAAFLMQLRSAQREQGVETEYIFVDADGRCLSQKRVQHAIKSA